MSKTIALTQGYVAIVNDEDYERLSSHSWSVTRNKLHVYAQRRKSDGRGVVRMHREVIDAPPGYEVDHINGDTLDNRKENLRLCTKAQHQHNRRNSGTHSSRFKGVGRHGSKWRAFIERSHLGVFESEEAAALAYDAEARRRFGSFAALNFNGGGNDD